MTAPEPFRPTSMAPTGHRLITSPSIDITRKSSLPALTCRHGSLVAPVPSISISSTAFNPWPPGSVLADAPGWENPSRMTGCVIAGSPEARWIVWTPEPGIAKTMRSSPKLPFASRMACRSDPAPESLVLVTVNVAADAGSANARTAVKKSLRTRPPREGRTPGRRTRPSGRASPGSTDNSCFRRSRS